MNKKKKIWEYTLVMVLMVSIMVGEWDKWNKNKLINKFKNRKKMNLNIRKRDFKIFII